MKRAYAGSCRQHHQRQSDRPGTVAFNSDGTLDNVNGAAPASGTFSLTIPWAASTGPGAADHRRQSGHRRRHLRPDPVRHRLGAERHHADGSAFGNVTGVTIAKDGTVTAQFSNGLSQDVYKIPVATFTNPGRPGPGDRQCLCRHQGIGRGQHQPGQFRRAPAASQSKSLEGSTVDLATEFTNLITTQRAYSRIGAHHHHRGPDAAAAGTVADELRMTGKARKTGFSRIIATVEQSFYGFVYHGSWPFLNGGAA